MIENRRLLSPKVQEAYYAKIAERYLAFCTDAGDSDGLQKQFGRLAITDSQQLPSSSSPTPPPSRPPTSHSNPQQKQTNDSDLGQILSALRKLREGIVASRRRDTFAAQVYLFAVRLGILTSSYETYYPALLYLLHTLHPMSTTSTTATTTNSNPTPQASPSASLLTPVELHEAQSYLILDTACRTGDLAEAYALRRRFRFADAKVDAALRALAHDNWVAWRRVARTVDGHRARIMEFAEPELRTHTLKAIGRSYLSADMGFVEKATGLAWEELKTRFAVGWELEQPPGGLGEGEIARVIIRRVKVR
ncbi:hypothetical protein N656DRAFT_768732 [Canariomyces notabilis]|uniref:CSN8/PSMD8/EIF3K domain-containing protein n=1 Tax=Canariomyces notabilis TaxID=2074819 RepID=A0AAN6YRJ8_9PEZI|nr:hypothetical protein N656DRAFT_768732 [Canariomyces arenarius]